MGGVKIGSNINIDVNGVISTHSPYVLPTASAQTLGGVKVGNNLDIDQNGVLSGMGVAIIGSNLVFTSQQDILEVINNAGY